MMVPTKIQITLTPQETQALKKFAEQFDYSLPKTIHYLISKTAENVFKDEDRLYQSELQEDLY